MQRIPVNLTNDCDRNQLNYNNDLPVIGNKNYALQKPFETDFLTVIGNAKLRTSFVICWVAQGRRPRCGPRYPISHSNVFFYVKLFALIILSRNSLKCILWCLIKLSDPFIKNEYSVLPILIEKNFQQKIYFCLLKIRSIFLKKENPIFSIKLWTEITEIIFSTSCKKFKIFPCILFEKRRLDQGIRRPKAADSPLPKFPTWYWFSVLRQYWHSILNI